MELCPDCYLPMWTPEAEDASGPETPWCECSLLKVEDYTYNEDE